MSCTCCGCYQTILQPDSLWWASTRFNLDANYVCGTCLASIPAAERFPTEILEEFKITFGPVFASANSRGVYQSDGSTMGEPRFWVEASILREILPEGRTFWPAFGLSTAWKRLSRG